MISMEYSITAHKDNKRHHLQIEAHSLTTAYLIAQQRGYSRPQIRHSSKWSSVAEINIFPPRPLAAKQLLNFTHKLSVMVGAGLPVIDALELLSRQYKQKTAQKILTDIIHSVQQGKSLHAAFSSHPRHFSPLYLNMIAAGEASGQLDLFLKRLATWLETQQMLKSSVTSALFYPITLLVITIGISLFMMINIVPVFTEMYDALGAELPGPTTSLIALSEIISSPVMLGATLLVILFISTAHMLGRKWQKYRLGISLVVLKTPLFGIIIQKSSVARICHILANLMQAGVNLPQALTLAAESTSLEAIKIATLSVASELYSGERLSYLFSRHAVFPEELSHMLAAGERTGTTDEMLTALARYYTHETQTLLKALTTLIEPVMIVFIGAVIGGLVIALYLPIFSAGGAIAG